MTFMTSLCGMLTGGSEWTLEDTIELKNINVSHPQVSIDMSYLTDLIDTLNYNKVRTTKQHQMAVSRVTITHYLVMSRLQNSLVAPRSTNIK